MTDPDLTDACLGDRRGCRPAAETQMTSSGGPARTEELKHRK